MLRRIVLQNIFAKVRKEVDVLSNPILLILLVLVLAVLLGEVFEQLGFASVVGELIAGVILGPGVAKVVQQSSQTEVISLLALFFIIFSIGFEMSTEILGRQLTKGLVISATSFVFPFVVFYYISSLFLAPNYLTVAIISLIICIPSISIVSVLVVQFGLLEKEIGQVILASVTFVDVLGFIIFSSLTLGVQRSIPNYVYIALFIASFLFVDIIIRKKMAEARSLFSRISRMLRREEIPFAILLIAALASSVIIELIGVYYVIGAFLAGLLIHEGLVGKKTFESLSNSLKRINNGFFIPVFFGLAGTGVLITKDLVSIIVPLGLSSLVALSLSYLLTRSVSRLIGFKGNDPNTLASIMGGRGAVGIAIATLALQNNYITKEIYSACILLTIAISLVFSSLERKRD